MDTRPSTPQGTSLFGQSDVDVYIDIYVHMLAGVQMPRCAGLKVAVLNCPCKLSDLLIVSPGHETDSGFVGSNKLSHWPRLCSAVQSVDNAAKERTVGIC